MKIYVKFKAEVQLITYKVKGSKAEIGEMIKSIGKCEPALKQEYESLRTLITPSQDIRRKMDSCTSVTTEITLLLKRRYVDVDIKEFDAVAVKESLQKLLQREDATSVYGSTVSITK